jgi:broad specificity phosphatase PhoE
MPANTWGLSRTGEQQCTALAQALTPDLPAALVCSSEPKAAATAQLVGKELGLAHREIPGLEEHHRSRVPYLSEPIFKQRVAQFFAEPETLVFGDETAAQALARFSTAIEQAQAAHPNTNLIAVAHGTVIALFVAHHAGGDAFEFWNRLDLPSFVAIDAGRVVALVPSIRA